jgi:hypothetical protein
MLNAELGYLYVKKIIHRSLIQRDFNNENSGLACGMDNVHINAQDIMRLN